LLFCLGLSWSDWFFAHKVFTVGLLIIGLWIGYQQGKFWYVRIYGRKGGEL